MRVWPVASESLLPSLKIRMGHLAKPLIYLAGPYTLTDPVHNTHKIIKIASEIYDSGHAVPLIPHLSLLWHLVDPRPIDFWYEYDMHLLARCDALLRVPGKSSGADAEVDKAQELRILVFDKLSRLLYWAERFSSQ